VSRIESILWLRPFTNSRYVAFIYEATIRAVPAILQFYFGHIVSEAEFHLDNFPGQSAVFLEMRMLPIHDLDTR